MTCFVYLKVKKTKSVINSKLNLNKILKCHFSFSLINVEYFYVDSLANSERNFSIPSCFLSINIL
jgi:hypothetical protein